MPQQTKKRGKDMQVKVVDCRHVYTGRNERGDEFQIYEITAQKPDGNAINEKLRAFTALPVGQLIDVTVVPYESEQWGRSFTLHPKNGKSAGTTAQVNELRDLCTELESRVTELFRRMREVEGRLGEVMKDDARHTRFGNAPAQSQAKTAELDDRFGKDPPW